MEKAVKAPTAVSGEAVEKAVKALLKWRDSDSKSQKAQLLPSDDFVYLVVTLSKIPPQSRTNPYKLPLIHPLYSPDSDGSELCLFLDDRPDRLPTSKDAKAKIAGESIPLPKVIKFSKLKTDYKPFEAKRKLCDSYDMFLADRRIIPLLPKHLGKHFFKKKKIPVAVDLEHQNWKEQVERLCSSALLHLKTGTCSTVRVARSSMALGDIVGNVVAAINGVAETVPRKWNNIRSLHLKLSDSVALPIYQSLPEANLNAVESAAEGKKRGREEEDAVLSTEGKKRGRKEGEAVLSSRKSPRASSKKGRIHEVRYMDDQKVEEEVHPPKKSTKTKNNDNQKAEEEVHLPKKSAKTKKGMNLKAEGAVKKEADGAKKKRANKDELGEADGAKKKRTNKTELGEADEAKKKITNKTELGEADGVKKKRANKDELGEADGAKKKRTNKTELGEADGAKKKRTNKTELGEADGAKKKITNKTELGEADGAKKKRTNKTELGETDGAKKKRAKKAELGEADGSKIKKADKVSKMTSAKKNRRS